MQKAEKKLAWIGRCISISFCFASRWERVERLPVKSINNIVDLQDRAHRFGC